MSWLWLDPACAGTFRSYDELRAYAGAPGETVSVNGDGIAGQFKFVSGAREEDGGIIIKAPHGRWERVFAYSPAQPVELDWFELKNGDEITPLLTRLAKRSVSGLYIRAPSATMTLLLDFIDLGLYGIREFYFLESESPITIRQKEQAMHPDKLIALADYRRVRIGGEKLNLTFTGLHKGVRGGHNARANGDAGHGLLSFQQSGSQGEFLEFSANIWNSRMYGIDHRGAHAGDVGRTQRVEIAGNFLNSGLRLNSGIRKLILKNPLLTDPYGVTFGWDGTQSERNNGYNADPHYWERSRGISMTYIDHVSGSMRSEYGGSGWFMSTVGFIGNSPDDPFIVRYRDMGYSISGVKIDTRGFLDTGGKTDHLGTGGGKFLKLIEDSHQYGFGVRNSAMLEATSEDGPGGGIYFNEGVHLELENISGNINTALINYGGDYSRNHVIHGNMIAMEGRRHPELTIFDGDQVHDFAGYRIILNYNERLGQAARNNVIRDSRILPGGYITVGAGANGNRIERTAFEGAARRLIHIANAKAPQLPVSLELRSITAPAGSTIEADVDTNVAVTLDKVRLALPYVFKERL
jgi:hypothetical protein